MSNPGDYSQARLDAVQTARATARTAPRRGGLPRRRGWLVVLAAVAVATPALAITQPWDPTIGRPDVEGPVASDRSPVTPAAKNVLAVLRRPQTAADRERTAPLLQGISGTVINGVQTASIRALADGWALVPATSVQTGPGVSRGDQLCFTNGSSTTCGSANRLASSGIASSEATTTSTTFTGLVPDGVASVRFAGADGTRKTAAVTSNFYELVVNEVAPPTMIDAPQGYDGSAQIPAPPMPVAGTVDWLDANGSVIGPAR